MKRYIEQYSDLAEAFKELRDTRYPFYLVSHNAVLKDMQWRDLNAFFHSGICNLFAEKTGYTKEEAKRELQKRHALFVEADNHFEVESVGGMSYERLMRFIDDCQHTLITEFGVYADPNIHNIDTKKIKK